MAVDAIFLPDFPIKVLELGDKRYYKINHPQ